MKNLLDLHSIRGKFMLNMYILNTIIFSILVSYLSYKYFYLKEDANYIIFGLSITVIIINILMYNVSYLCYYDSINSVLKLKKPFRKKIWTIKLEEIIKIEKTRLFIARGKHMEIVVNNKDKTDTISYYVLISRVGSLFGMDDVNFLEDEVRKRKMEIKNSK